MASVLSMNSVGVVFNIQRFSIHDGPGIRTTVFLKGCPMRCYWCHNPEGRHPYPEIRYHADRCIACGACVAACPNHAHELVNGAHVFNRDLCRVSGECVQTCYSGALELNGRLMSVSQILEEVLRDRAFYDGSNGGVTLSGGEPSLFSHFARCILEACKAEGLHTAIETCGEIAWRSYEEILPFTDLVMMDLKLVTPENHLAVTGRSNERILANARNLALSDKPLLFRTPVVPTVNDNEEEVAKISQFIRSLIDLRHRNGGVVKNHAAITYELLPFHKLASDKYTSLGMDYPAAALDTPAKSRMLELLDVVKMHGIDARIR
jgi:pyruvate formate lyase activating enzyme